MWSRREWMAGILMARMSVNGRVRGKVRPYDDVMTQLKLIVDRINKKTQISEESFVYIGHSGEICRIFASHLFCYDLVFQVNTLFRIHIIYWIVSAQTTNTSIHSFVSQSISICDRCTAHHCTIAKAITIDRCSLRIRIHNKHNTNEWVLDSIY